MKFSVIVPVFNVEPCLSDCLDSVMAQSYSDWECVCVDDGSTDGSGSILDRYALKDSRFRVVHKENEGVASARNLGLDLIAGEWFLFLDSDDVWAPDLLELCKDAIEFCPDAHVVGFGVQSFADIHELQWQASPQKWTFEITDTTSDFSHNWMGFALFKHAYRAELLGGIRQKSYSVGEDLVYLIECALRAKTLVSCNASIYGYRVRTDSAIHSRPTLKKTLDSLHAAKSVYEVLLDSKRVLSRATRKWLGVILFEDSVLNGNRLQGQDRCEYFKEWNQVVADLDNKEPFLWMDKMRLRVVAPLHYGKIAWLLCGFPHLLRRIWTHK